MEVKAITSEVSASPEAYTILGRGKLDITAWSICTAFAIAVALLYLIGYWYSFGINILEFIQLSDILKLATFPVLIGGFYLLGAIVYAPVLLPSVAKWEEKVAGLEIKEMPFGIERIIKGGLTLESIFYIYNLVIIIILPVSLKWQLGAICTGVLIIKTMKRGGSFLSPWISSQMLRAQVITVAILFPLYSFGLGKGNAELVLSGIYCKVVNTKVFREGVDKLDGQTSLKYIGVAGDNVFFLSMDNNKTYIVKDSDLYFVELTDYSSPQPHPFLDMSLHSLYKMLYRKASSSSSPIPVLKLPKNMGT